MNTLEESVSILLNDIRSSGYRPDKSMYKCKVGIVSPERSLSICNLTPSQYVKRLESKHNFVFNPISDLWDSSVTRVNGGIVVISSPLPNSKECLLVFLHELGHMKALQVEEEVHLFSWGNSSHRVISEILAWENALSRFYKYGFTLTKELWDSIVIKALNSYTDSLEKADDADFAHGLIHKLADKYNMKYIAAVRQIVEIGGIRYLGSLNRENKTPKKGGKKHEVPFWANDWRKR